MELEHGSYICDFPCPSIFLPLLRFPPFPWEYTKDNKHHTRKHSHFCKIVLKTMCSAIPRPRGSWPLGSLSISFFGHKERETSTVARRGARCTDARSTSPWFYLSLENGKFWKEESTLDPADFKCHCFNFMRGEDILKSRILMACETFFLLSWGCDWAVSWISHSMQQSNKIVPWCLVVILIW